MNEGLICLVDRLPSNIAVRMGRHLVFTRCRKTSSDADLPSLPNNAFTDLKTERLALSKEHLNLQDRIISAKGKGSDLGRYFWLTVSRSLHVARR